MKRPPLLESALGIVFGWLVGCALIVVTAATVWAVKELL